MFGVIHIIAVDGYSRQIVRMVTLPRKNPIMIYRYVLKPVLEFYGLWDQIRVDHGTEFVLTNFVQRHLSSQRLRQTRPAVLQTSSRQNHRAERMWSEVNQRINYPVKRLLIQLEEDGIINMHDECTKFFVSWVTIAVVTPATKAFVSSWNLHRIQGRGGGIPLVLASTRNFTSSLSHIPTVQEAVNMYLGEGGNLTPESGIGHDPLQDYSQLQVLRERDFFERYNMELVFQNILHSNGNLFSDCLQFFISITENMYDMVG